MFPGPARLAARFGSCGAAASGAVALLATPAGAHVGGPTSGLADGVLHPLTGPDHLLAMVAVGVLAVSVSAGAWWVAPAAFLAGMTIGGALGLGGIALPAIELLIAASVVLLGVAVALAPRLGAPALVGLIAIAGIAHGHAHGSEAPAGSNAVLYGLGFLAVTAALHLCGVLAGLGLRAASSLRFVVGLTVATSGVLLVV